MQQSSGSNALLVLPHPRLQISMYSIVYLSVAEVPGYANLKKRMKKKYILEKLRITKARVAHNMFQWLQTKIQQSKIAVTKI